MLTLYTPLSPNNISHPFNELDSDYSGHLVNFEGSFACIPSVGTNKCEPELGR